MKIHLRYWTVCVVVATLCVGAPISAATATVAEKRVIKLPVIVQGASATKARLILEKAYAAIGIDVVFVNMPGERALMESTHGGMDGEITRTASIEPDHPQLLRVPVPLYFFSISTLVRNEPGVAAPSLEDARKMNRVGLVRGLKATEVVLRGWPNLTMANNLDTALKMLQAKRFDVLVTATEAVQATMQANQLLAASFKLRTVMTMPAYHYLNRNNAALVPVIGAELAKLKGKSACVLDGVAIESAEGAR